MADPTSAPIAQLHVSCTVNGQAVEADIDARTNLADFLRDELDLTGTHLGCEHGVCGACTVLVDGAAVRSCLMLAAQAEGAEVLTIESLAVDGELGPIQQGMQESHGFQCAFCSPGFMMTIAALLDRNPDPTPDEIRDEISGNLCRCTGYQSIVAGIERAVQIRRGEAS